MIVFIQQLLNGLQLGSIYALVALGYTMVYGIVKLINFAHGEIIMVGAYVAYFTVPTLRDWGVPIWLSMFIAAIFCAILGVMIEVVAYRPLRKAPKLCSIITAIGMSLFLQNLAQLLWKPDPRPFPQVISREPVVIGGVSTSWNAIITIVVSLGLMVLMQIFVKKTKSGRSMRCVSEDMGAAKLMGINVNRTVSLTFAIGSALAAIGAVFYANSYPRITPTMGSLMGLKAFIAAVLGGIGVIPGAILGGIIMGVAETLTKGYISSQLADAVVFGILIIVLLVKPSGLLGKKARVKV